MRKGEWGMRKLEGGSWNWEGLLNKNELRTSNIQHRMLNRKDEEIEELIKIFVTSIKTVEKEQK